MGVMGWMLLMGLMGLGLPNPTPPHTCPRSSPLLGPRFKSLRLPNFDLCSECTARPEASAAAPFECIGGGGAGSSATADVGAAGGQQQQGQPQGPQRQHLHWPLVQWVWRYFSGQHATTQQ